MMSEMIAVARVPRNYRLSGDQSKHPSIDLKHRHLKIKINTVTLKGEYMRLS
jgi:hypothetical protein